MSEERRDVLEAERKLAKRWLRELRSGDAEATQRFQRVMPGVRGRPGLRQVQQALARERGFESWAALCAQLTIERHAEQLEARGLTALEAEFLQRACIFSGGELDAPRKWRSALRLLERNPELARCSLHTAALCGDVEGVEQFLWSDASQVHTRRGPQGWPPLLFVCYGRLGTRAAADHSVEIAERLLDAGADPNAHFVTDDAWRLRFSALSGAMGHGEMGQPEHPRATELARLLLGRGAEPNDGQGLYNTHLLANDDTKWLELLFEHGLTADAPINWHADPADAHHSGADRMRSIADYLLAQATARGEQKRVRCLLAHGADPNARSMYSGHTCHALALLNDQGVIAELLREHGATVSVLSGHDAFVAACRRGDREQAERLLGEHPEYAHDAEPLVDAARTGKLEVLRLLLGLGLDANGIGKHDQRALHNAATNRQAAELLLAHGADPNLRCYGGTPAQWALLRDDLEMGRFFAEQSRSIFDAVLASHLALVEELLQEEPSRAHLRGPEGVTPLHELPTDPEASESIATLLLAAGAELHARDERGRTPAERLRRAGAYDTADLLEALGPPAED